MRYQYYELSSDSLDLCNGKLTPGVTATWGEIAGNIETQKDLVSYISAHGTAAWGNISGSITDQTDLIEYTDRFATTAWVSEQNYLTSASLTGYATESWVESKGYLTEHQDLTGYATESWVSAQGYLVSDDLSQYATRQWVTGRGYITTSALSGYATESWVSSQGYVTSGTLRGYATESWVQEQGYVVDAANGWYVLWDHVIIEDPYIQLPDNYPFGVYTADYDAEGIYRFGSFNPETLEFHGIQIDQDVAGRYTVMPSERGYDETFDEFATQTWVREKGYITTSALSSYATQSWVQSQGYLVNEPGNPYQTRTDLENFATYLKNYDLPNAGFVTQSWVSSQNFLQESSTAIQSLEARLSALETNYGDAITITNNILS